MIKKIIYGMVIFLLLIVIVFLILNKYVTDAEIVLKEGTYYSKPFLNGGIYFNDGSAKEDIKISKNKTALFYKNDYYVFYKQQQTGTIYRIDRVSLNEIYILEYAQALRIIGEYIYYMDDENMLYRTDFAGRDKEKLYTNRVSSYKVEKGEIVVREIDTNKYFKFPEFVD